MGRCDRREQMAINLDRGKTLLKSKFIVILAMALFWIAGTITINGQASQGDAFYKFSNVFQYYMLDNSKGDDMTQASNITEKDKKKTVASMGNLGSGGASGTFSYDDIVNSIDGKDRKKIAKSFCSEMATYSTFKYTSNQVQGFESIFQYLGKSLLMVILLPLGFVTDLLNLIVPAFISLVAKLNVITLLGNLYMKSDMGARTAKYFGVSIPDLKVFMDAALAFAISAILISVVLTIRKGNIDTRHSGKLKGRLFNLVALGIVVSGGATIIQDASQLVAKTKQFDSGFAQYLIDDRSWAYNYNFTPSGNDTGAKNDIKPGKGSYVDLSFNPYSDKGKARIHDINKDSSLAGGKKIFSNSALAYSYCANESFSAVDFINYKGSEASKYKYGQPGQKLDSLAGSYYEYANKMAKNGDLNDVDQVFTGSDTKENKGFDTKGPYKSAKDDYFKKEHSKIVWKTTPQVAYRDRFIYGVKSAGKNVDKYYKEDPSWEQIITTVGSSNGGYGMANGSMYLILSTIFSETGGRYYIGAPARGIMNSVPSFDSNRSNYNVVSMVGNPFFSIPGMISEPLIRVIVFLMAICAIEAIGLIEMNVKPAAAWFKGLFIGDIEYSYAFIIYSIGIAGTVLGLMVIPNLIVAIFTSAATLISVPIPEGVQTPQGSLSFFGFQLVIEAIVAVAMGILFLKSKKFRDAMTDALIFPWSWASTTGERLERRVNPYGAAVKAKSNEKRSKSKILKAMDDANANGDNAWKTIGKASRTLASEMTPKQIKSAFSGNDNPDNRKAKESDKEAMTYDALKRKSSVNNVNKELSGLMEDTPEISALTTSQINDVSHQLSAFEQVPNKENLIESEEKLEDLRENMVRHGAQPQDIKTVDRAMMELHRLDQDYGIENKNDGKNKAIERNDIRPNEGTQILDENGKPILLDSNESKKLPNNNNSSISSEHRTMIEDPKKLSDLDQENDQNLDESDNDSQVNSNKKQNITDDKNTTLHSEHKVTNTRIGKEDNNNLEDITQLAEKDAKNNLNKGEKKSLDNGKNNELVKDNKQIPGKDGNVIAAQKHTQTKSDEELPIHSEHRTTGTQISDNKAVEKQVSNKHALNQSSDINESKTSVNKHEVPEPVKDKLSSRYGNKEDRIPTNAVKEMRNTDTGFGKSTKGKITTHDQNGNNGTDAKVLNAATNMNDHKVDRRSVQKTNKTSSFSQNNNVKEPRVNNDVRNYKYQKINNNRVNKSFNSTVTNDLRRQVRNERIQQVNALRHAMGPARKDEKIRRAISILGQAHSEEEFMNGVKNLKGAMNNLNPVIQGQIKQKNTTQSLHNMIHSIQLDKGKI
jgi:hypothetical protein